MKIFLFIVAIVALIASLGTCVMAKSLIQETVGVALLIVAVLAIGFAAVLEQLERVSKEMIEQFRYLAEFLRERMK